MAEQHLGEIRLYAKNPAGNFYTWPVTNASITDDLESDLLDDATHINGFDANGNDKVLEEEVPDRSFQAVEVEPGTQRVFGTFHDAGNAENKYEVLVFLMVEEPEEPEETVMQVNQP